MPIYLERGPKTDDELHALVKAMWGMTIPRHKVCADHDAPFDAFAHAYFNRDPQILIRGSRGLAGKSRLMSILGITMAAVKGGDVNIVGGSLNQSNNIHETIRDAFDYKNAPTYLIKDQSQTIIRMHNGSRIRPLTASQKSVRGPHPPTLICVAGWERIETPEGYKRLDEVVEGQIVRVSDDMRTSRWGIVSRVLDKGYRDVITLGLSDGRELTVTEDHRIATKRGWVEAKDLTSEDVLIVRDRDSRQRRSQDRHVSRVLAADQAQSGLPLPGMRQGTADVQGNTLQRLLHRGKESPGSVLCGLRDATEAEDDQALSSVPSAVHDIGEDADQVRRSKSHGEGRNQNLEGRGTSSSAAGSAGAAIRTAGPVRTLGDRFPCAEVESVHRGARRLLARSGEERGQGRAQDGQVDSGRSQGAVLAHGHRVLVDEVHVRSVRPGPAVHVWDLTTDTGNFYASGVLVHNCDEIDEMDLEILESAKGQPMPQKNWQGETIPAQTVFGSTLQYPDKTMAIEMARFEAEGLPTFNWCHFESSNPVDGWLDPSFIEQKKREVSAERWRVEYELGEPSIGTRAFDSEAVERTFSLPKDVIQQKVGKDYAEYQFEDYRFDREYVIGADWAKAQDYTVFTIYDCTHLPVKVVYWVKMRRRPYPVMIEHFNRLIKKYYAEPIHDATGLGGVVADYLDRRARGFMMTGEKRDNMLSEFVNAVENDKIRAPRIDEFRKAVLYASVDDLYSRAKEFHLPDEVCSMALAWHLVSRRVPAAQPIMLEGSDKKNWMGDAVEQNKSPENTKGWIGEVTGSGKPEQSYDLMV